MTGDTAKWIASLIDALDKNVDEKTRVRILEQCGRQCQSQSFIEKARDLYQKSGSVDEFLKKLGQSFKYLHKEGDKIYFIYPKCFCAQVNKIPQGKLSGTYCNCSRGWIKALFEGALGKPIEAIMEESIVNGDKQCKFRIIL